MNWLAGASALGNTFPGRSGEEGPDRRRQLDRGRHHRHRQRGHRGDPLEGRRIHAAASATAAGGLIGWRSPPASIG